MIKAPAIANEETSIPKIPKIAAPKNKKAIIITAAKLVATDALISTPSFFILIKIGSDPMMSITENKIKLTDKIAVMFIENIF